MCIFAADFRRSGLARRNSHASLACRHSSSILEATSFSDGYKEYLRDKKRENRCPRNSRYSRDIENPNY